MCLVRCNNKCWRACRGQLSMRLRRTSMIILLIKQPHSEPHVAGSDMSWNQSWFWLSGRGVEYNTFKSAKGDRGPSTLLIVANQSGRAPKGWVSLVLQIDTASRLPEVYEECSWNGSKKTFYSEANVNNLEFTSWWILSLVGGLEHFLFSHILGIIIPID